MNSLCFHNFVDVHSLYDSYGRKNKEFLVSSLSRLAWRTLPPEAISAWDLWKVLKYMLHWDSVVTCNFLSRYSSVNGRKNIKFESKMVKTLFGWLFSLCFVDGYSWHHCVVFEKLSFFIFQLSIDDDLFSVCFPPYQPWLSRLPSTTSERNRPLVLIIITVLMIQSRVSGKTELYLEHCPHWMMTDVDVSTPSGQQDFLGGIPRVYNKGD